MMVPCINKGFIQNSMYSNTDGPPGYTEHPADSNLIVLRWNPTPSPPPVPTPRIPPTTPPLSQPPAYYEPPRSIIYTFSPASFNSMVLLPPSNSLETRPRYHISVSHNCFNPSSYITSIRRGGTEAGEYVGEFEMGPSTSTKPDTVFIRDQEYFIEKSLLETGRPYHWNWLPPNDEMACSWDCSKWPHGRFICHSRSRRPDVFAMFTPVNGLRRPDRPNNLATLEVFPSGQRFFDDIVMSVLIIERKKLSGNV